MRRSIRQVRPARKLVLVDLGTRCYQNTVADCCWNQSCRYYRDIAGYCCLKGQCQLLNLSNWNFPENAEAKEKANANASDLYEAVDAQRTVTLLGPCRIVDAVIRLCWG